MNKNHIIIILVTLIGIGILFTSTQANYNVEKMLLGNDKGTAWVNVTDNFKTINNGYIDQKGEQFTVVKAFDLNNKDDAQSLNSIVNIDSKGEKFTDDTVEYYTVDYQALSNQMNAFGITTLVLKDKEVNIGFMYDKDTNICVVVVSSNFKHVENMLKTVDFEVNGTFHKGTQDLTQLYISTTNNTVEQSNTNTNNNQQNNNNNPNNAEELRKAREESFNSGRSYQSYLDSRDTRSPAPTGNSTR